MTIEIIEPSSENDMISTFLLAEIASSRFGESVLNSVRMIGGDRVLIENPNVNDSNENDLRRSMLMNYRGHYFNGFPNNVVWNRGELKITDIDKLRTINFDYWLDFSDNTRKITTVAGKIRRGSQYQDEPNDIFFQIAQSQEQLAVNPVILVGQHLDNLTILEGHFRLVAILLQERPNQVIPAIIGLSKNMDNWVLY